MFKGVNFYESILAPLAIGGASALASGLATGYGSHKLSKRREAERYFSGPEMNKIKDQSDARYEYNVFAEKLKEVNRHIQGAHRDIRLCRTEECVKKIDSELKELEEMGEKLSYRLAEYNMKKKYNMDISELDNDLSINESALIAAGIGGIAGAGLGAGIGRMTGKKKGREDAYNVYTPVLQDMDDIELLMLEMEQLEDSAGTEILRLKHLLNNTDPNNKERIKQIKNKIKQVESELEYNLKGYESTIEKIKNRYKENRLKDYKQLKTNRSTYYDDEWYNRR